MNPNTLIRRCLATLAVPEPTDGELVAGFLGGDADAFAQLVRRHGPIVLAVCRRQLGNSADAEDAFQATFLALARHASSLREAAALPAWLHRTALRAASRIHQRWGRAGPPARDAVDPADPFADVAWRDLRRVLDEELDRLPEKYRAPVVLCLLGGLTRDEAAARIGYSLNTLKRRLEAGRSLLRERLLRRGVAPLVLAAGVLDSDGLRAEVPERLMDSAVGLVRAGIAGPANWGATTLSTRGLALAAVIAIGVGALGAGISTPEPPRADAPSARTQPAETVRAGVDDHGDPLPAGALLRIGTIRYRDGGGTNQAILSPDGKTCATASSSGITLFNLSTGERKLWIRDSGVPDGAGPNSSRFAFAPDGKKLYTLSAPGAPSMVVVGAIAVLDAASGKKLAEFKAPPAPRKPNQVLDVSYTKLWFPSTSKHLIALRGKETVFIDPATGNEEGGLGFEVHAVEATPDGTRFFSIPKGTTTVAVHDETGKLLRTLEHADHPELIGFDPAGRIVAAVGQKAEVRIWDLASGKAIGNVSVPVPAGKSYSVTALAVTPDGKTVLAGSPKGVIHRCDIAAGKELPALGGMTHWINSLLFTDGGKTLVAAGWGHTIARFDLTTGKALPDATGYRGYFRADRSPDGRLIAAADSTGLLELLDGTTGKRLGLLHDTGKPVTTRAAFSPDGRLLATGHADARIRFWEPTSGKLVREVELGTAPEGGAWFTDLVFTPDGRAVVSSVRVLGMRMVEAETGKTIWDEPSGDGQIAILPGGRMLVTGGWDNTLSVRDAATGKVQSSSLSGHQVVDDVAISPDGKLLATGHHNGFVCLREPTTGAVRKEWRAHEGMCEVAWCASFGPGGIWLATGGGDGTVKIWDPPTGKLLRTFDGHASWVMSARFARDGRSLLSVSMDLTGYVWDVQPKLRPDEVRSTEQIWNDLKGEPEAAFRAVWLASVDPQAPDLFGKKLPSPPKPDAERFQKLVEELASGEFQVREKAEKELAKFGAAAFGLARKARAASDSQEVRSRLDRVMKGWTENVFAPEIWRQKRAVVAMELAGTDAARELLKRWAADAPGTTLSDDAAAALRRLGRRN